MREQHMNTFFQKHHKALFTLLSILTVGCGALFIYLLVTQPHRDAIVQHQESIVEAQPIIKDLPFKDPYFTISYKTLSRSSNDIIVTVYTTSPRYRYFALKYLKDHGYDPVDYTVEFVDFKNPLKETV